MIMADTEKPELPPETISKLCSDPALKAEVSLEIENFSIPYVGRDMPNEEKASGLQRSLDLLLG